MRPNLLQHSDMGPVNFSATLDKMLWPNANRTSVWGFPVLFMCLNS